MEEEGDQATIGWMTSKSKDFIDSPNQGWLTNFHFAVVVD
jgi:hypothetical protein